MGKFDKFKGKGNSQKGNLVRINKYDSKSAVLDLISYIATAQDEFEITPYFEPILKKVDEFVAEEKEKSDFYPIDDSLDALRNSIFNIIFNFIDELESNHGVGRINVAVGGGYSSGKSSFLNNVTGLGNLLPTGVEPVSIVNTLLTYSKDTKNLLIRGKNFKNAYVRLNKDILESIQHASKSKVYVASVLDNLLIDIPRSEDYLHNVTLVDTPGYNNSSNKNIENAKTDQETAKEAMIKSDAFIWCIDIEAGTIPSKDLDMIRDILKEGGEKPYIIMFTKRDKKNIDEQKNIITEALKIIKKSLPIMPYSILAYSSVEENPYLVANGKNIESFLNFLKKKSGNLDLKKKLWISLENSINECTGNLIKFNDQEEEERIELSKKKSELRDIKNQTSEGTRIDKANISNILIHNYDELMSALDERNEAIKYLANELEKSLNRENEWCDKSGFFSNVSSLINQHSKSVDKYNDFEFPEGYTYYDIKDREELMDFIAGKLEEDISDVENITKDINERYNDALKGKSQSQKCLGNLKDLKLTLYNLSNSCFDNFAKDVSYHYFGVEIENDDKGNIFSAIVSDDVKTFTSCLSDGVDFSICNKAGYNPLTYAVHCGNNEMVKYLINHDVDLSLKDDRGFNAFETAVIDHYQDICELILKKDPSLKYTDTPVELLYSRNTFKNWLNQL